MRHATTSALLRLPAYPVAYSLLAPPGFDYAATLHDQFAPVNPLTPAWHPCKSDGHEDSEETRSPYGAARVE